MKYDEPTVTVTYADGAVFGESLAIRQLKDDLYQAGIFKPEELERLHEQQVIDLVDAELNKQQGLAAIRGIWKEINTNYAE